MFPPQRFSDKTPRHQIDAVTTTCSHHLPPSLPISSLPTAAPCPANTAGVDVPSGCVAEAGTSGVVTATTVDPFYAIDGVNGGAVALLAGYSLVGCVVTGTSVHHFPV